MKKWVGYLILENLNRGILLGLLKGGASKNKTPEEGNKEVAPKGKRYG